MKTAKEILKPYERKATFSDNTKIERVITISKDKVENLENDMKWALLDIRQVDSNLERLYEGDKLDVYLEDKEFNRSELIATNVVIEYDVVYAQFIIRKDTMIIPFIEQYNGNFNIYRKGSLYDDRKKIGG